MAQDALVQWEYRCKICNMAKTHPDLFKELHYNVLEVGISQNQAMKYINKRIEDEGIQTPKLNNQNLHVHFNSHISLPDKISAELEKMSGPVQPALKTINPDVGMYVEDLVRRKIGNEVNDYLHLDQLRAQMTEKLELLDEVTSKEGEDGKKAIDLDAMTHYTSLIKEIRNCIVDLNKIRSSKQLMNMIIKSLIQKNTFEVVRQLSREYDQIKQDLINAGMTQDVVIRIDQQLRMRLVEIVANTAKQAVEDVSRSYKLQ